MRQVKYGLLFLLLLVFAAGCSDFFSASLAPWAARDPADLIPDVDAGNVWELVKLTEDDPDLSLELLKNIRGAAAGASPPDQAKLWAAGLTAAANASELGSAILRNLRGKDDLNADGIRSLINNALNDAGNLRAAAAVLEQILGTDPVTANPGFVNAASAGDLAMAAAILLAAEAKQSGLSNFIDSYMPDPGSLIYKLAAEAYGKPDVSGAIKDVIDGLNLI
ncbi:MAG: hypothetical protein LBO80_03580 [Treponema sp.]|nr:hypothetical protein [Treponema sp.]